MSRIITVADNDLGVEARIFLDKSGESGEPRITKLELSALEDRGIRSADLLILQELGLRLPDPNATVAPVAVAAPAFEVEAIASPIKEKKKTVPKKATAKLSYRIGAAGRIYYERPSVQELLRLYSEMGYSAAKVAAYYGIKPEVAAGWFTRLRQAGYDVPSKRKSPEVLSPPIPQ